MHITEHARKRIAERFPDRDINQMYVDAKAIGKGKRWRKLKRLCPRARKWMDNQFTGRYLLMTPDNVVFVMHKPETVITVFELGK